MWLPWHDTDVTRVFDGHPSYLTIEFTSWAVITRSVPILCLVSFSNAKSDPITSMALITSCISTTVALFSKFLMFLNMQLFNINVAIGRVEDFAPNAARYHAYFQTLDALNLGEGQLVVASHTAIDSEELSLNGTARLHSSARAPSELPAQLVVVASDPFIESAAPSVSGTTGVHSPMVAPSQLLVAPNPGSVLIDPSVCGTVHGHTTALAPSDSRAKKVHDHNVKVGDPEPIVGDPKHILASRPITSGLLNDPPSFDVLIDEFGVFDAMKAQPRSNRSGAKKQSSESDSCCFLVTCCYGEDYVRASVVEEMERERLKKCNCGQGRGGRARAGAVGEGAAGSTEGVRGADARSAGHYDRRLPSPRRC